MGKKILSLTLMLLFASSMFAQTDVYLKINHMLGSNPFAFNQTTSNNMGNSFQVERLEYYLSQIVLTHDGGQQTMVPNTWLIVDANTPTNELLGTFNITNLEGIGFAVGVDSSVNHDDPSLWPVSHPLAPRTPSMHWGWNGGYRFVAYEGKTGPNMTDGFEIHALGDNNYNSQTIQTAGTLNGPDLVVELDADYAMGLKDITVAPGLITHGEFQEAEELLLNFQSDVFTATPIATQLLNTEEYFLDVFPNPSSNGKVHLRYSDNLHKSNLTIYDVTGHLIQKTILSNAKAAHIQIETPGCYLMTISRKGKIQAVKKLIITQ